jgi:nucleoside-diphosphate-sugar epimerase
MRHWPRAVVMALASGVELLGRLLRREVPLTRYRVRSLRPLDGFDTTLARETLGWSPRVGSLEGLSRTFGRPADEARP